MYLKHEAARLHFERVGDCCLSIVPGKRQVGAWGTYIYVTYVMRARRMDPRTESVALHIYGGMKAGGSKG